MTKYYINAIATYGFMLALNPMQRNTENFESFGPFVTLEALRVFYDGEKVEMYQEEGPNCFDGGVKVYNKSFRKDGPLEWMNPLTEVEWITPSYFGHGVHEEIMEVTNIVRNGPAF